MEQITCLQRCYSPKSRKRRCFSIQDTMSLSCKTSSASLLPVTSILLLLTRTWAEILIPNGLGLKANYSTLVCNSCLKSRICQNMDAKNDFCKNGIIRCSIYTTIQLQLRSRVRVTVGINVRPFYSSNHRQEWWLVPLLIRWRGSVCKITRTKPGFENKVILVYPEILTRREHCVGEKA